MTRTKDKKEEARTLNRLALIEGKVCTIAWERGIHSPAMTHSGPSRSFTLSLSTLAFVCWGPLQNVWSHRRGAPPPSSCTVEKIARMCYVYVLHEHETGRHVECSSPLWRVVQLGWDNSTMMRLKSRPDIQIHHTLPISSQTRTARRLVPADKIVAAPADGVPVRIFGWSALFSFSFGRRELQLDNIQTRFCFFGLANLSC